MKRLTLLPLFGLLFSLNALGFDRKELEKWERKILPEAEKLEKKQPEKAYWAYVNAARELSLFNIKDKASAYYERALKLSPKGPDQAEIYVQLTNLNRDDKKKRARYLSRLETFLKQHPEKKTSALNHWITAMKGEGKPAAFHGQFFQDQQTEAKMKEGRYQEALAGFSPEGLEARDINSKITYDLLSSVVLGKATARLYCEPSLKQYPDSIAWTMRICRYLRDWRAGAKGTESVQAIREQLRTEDPKRVYFTEALKKL